MTKTARILFHDIARAPLAVLIVVLGLCAGLSPSAGAGQGAGFPGGPAAVTWHAGTPAPAVAERLPLIAKGAPGERDPFAGLPPSLDEFQPARWIGVPVFRKLPLAQRREAPARPYQARAPPAV